MSDIVDQVAKARNFPHNTTPASRHVELMAECLMRGEKYALLDEEPAYCAEAMLSVVAGFYEAAAEIERLRAALAGAEAWLDVWAEHVGDCDGGVSCTCGLTAIHFEANAALFPKPVSEPPREPIESKE